MRDYHVRNCGLKRIGGPSSLRTPDAFRDSHSQRCSTNRTHLLCTQRPESNHRSQFRPADFFRLLCDACVRFDGNTSYPPANQVIQGPVLPDASTLHHLWAEVTFSLWLAVTPTPCNDPPSLCVELKLDSENDIDKREPSFVAPAAAQALERDTHDPPAWCIYLQHLIYRVFGLDKPQKSKRIARGL